MEKELSYEDSYIYIHDLEVAVKRDELADYLIATYKQGYFEYLLSPLQSWTLDTNDLKVDDTGVLAWWTADCIDECGISCGGDHVDMLRLVASECRVAVLDAPPIYI